MKFHISEHQLPMTCVNHNNAIINNSENWPAQTKGESTFLPVLGLVYHEFKPCLFSESITRLPLPSTFTAPSTHYRINNSFLLCWTNMVILTKLWKVICMHRLRPLIRKYFTTSDLFGLNQWDWRSHLWQKYISIKCLNLCIRVFPQFLAHCKITNAYNWLEKAP